LKAAARLQGLWRHADFMRLWSAAGISAVGSQVTLLALPLTAILVLPASAFEVAAISTAVTLPNLLGGAAGVWVDRVRRRRVMIAADWRGSEESGDELGDSHARRRLARRTGDSPRRLCTQTLLRG
jgi:hypothetical protein